MNQQKIYVTLALLLLAACSGVAVKRVTLESIPSGATVLARNGKVLGKTPFKMADTTRTGAIASDRLSVIVSQDGFVPREVSLDLHGNDRYVVKLQALDQSFFMNHFVGEYGSEMNAFTRELLRLHSLIISKQFETADAGLTEFLQKYPNIAAAYVLKANAAIAKGDRVAAKSFLLRAKSLDVMDNVVPRMLAELGEAE